MTHQLKGHTGFARIVRATGHSIDGIKSAFVSESAFRQEIVVAIVMLPAATWLARSWVEWSLLAGSVLLVLIVELLNSAVEAAIDRVSLELHMLSKRAKDMGSAAVFISVLLCAAIWIAALWSRFGGPTP